MRISSLKWGPMPAPDLAGVRYAGGAPWFDSSYSRLGCFSAEGSKTGIEGAVCDAPAAFQVKNSPAECGRRWDERYTSHANRAGCMQPVYSSIYVEDLSQKKQSWWISTTARGDFQPKKILI
jgi:hypothetical protein